MKVYPFSLWSMAEFGRPPKVERSVIYLCQLLRKYHVWASKEKIGQLMSGLELTVYCHVGFLVRLACQEEEVSFHMDGLPLKISHLNTTSCLQYKKRNHRTCCKIGPQARKLNGNNTDLFVITCNSTKIFRFILFL